MRELTATQLHAYLEESDVEPLLLDVREQWEFERCHLDGAVLVPMSRLHGALSELDPERETVVICHHGIRSRLVARFLEQSGFRNVINLSNGVDGWARDVDTSMETY